jgi:pimeloyl-ACP methyl ester carboxylesterase
MSLPAAFTRTLKTPCGVAYSRGALGARAAAAPPLLLLTHATGFMRAQWLPVLEELAQLPGAPPCDFAALDFAGHGDSQAPPPPPSAWSDYCVDNVRAVLAAEAAAGAPRRFVLGAGHSMGAAALAQAELRNPGTFAALVLVEPVLLPWHLKLGLALMGNPLAPRAERRRDAWPSREAARAFFGERLASWDPRAIDAFVAHGLREVGGGGGGVALKCAKADEARTYRSGDATSHGALRAIAAPTVVVAGGASRFLYPYGGGGRYWRALAGCFGDGRFESADGASHMVPMEKPAEIAAVISAALVRMSEG